MRLLSGRVEENLKTESVNGDDYWFDKAFKFTLLQMNDICDEIFEFEFSVFTNGNE